MFKKQNIGIVVIIILSFFYLLNAQISEEQIEKDIDFDINMHATLNTPETEAHIDSVYTRIFENSDLYIPKLEERLYLPDDIDILSKGDTLYVYRQIIGLLFLLGRENQQARDIVQREYDKMSDIIYSIYPNIDTPYKQEENKVLYKAFSNIRKIQRYLIRTAGLNNDTLFIEDCLERIDKIPGFYHTMLIYFDSVAYNNERVITKLIELYQDPNFEYSGQPSLKDRIERMGGEITEIEQSLPVKIINSQSQLLPEGTLKYYEGGWKDAVSNGDGTFKVETDLETVKLRMTYAFASLDMDNVPVNGDTAVFQTVQTEVQ